MKSQAKIDQNGNVLLDFSPWILAIACSLLLLLLTLFGVSNYQREKSLIIDAIGQKGITLLRFMNSSVRGSIRDTLQLSRDPVKWEEHMQEVMERAIEQHGVEYIQLITSSGNILVAAGRGESGQVIDAETLHFALQLDKGGAKRFISRMIKKGKGKTGKVQIAAWYMPPDRHGRFPDFFQGRGGRGNKMMRFGHHPQFRMVQERLKRLLAKSPVYIVQLDFEQFNSPLKRQLLQIVILSAVTLLVGLGGALSYMTLKGLKGSETRLKKIRAFTDVLVTSLPVGLIATDESGEIKVYNSTAKDFLGLDGTVVLDELPEKCLPSGFVQMFHRNEMESAEGRQTEMHFQPSEGVDKILQLASVTIPDSDGNLVGEVLLIRDMTSFKKLERELQRSERLAALGKMAAGVAHELRNPMSSIKGLAVLLRSRLPENSSDADSADILVGEVERLNRSIGELLDYARPGKLNRETIEVDELIRKSVSLVRLDAQNYAIDVEVQCKEKVGSILGDRDKLNQVLLNIYLNAIQAMADGGFLTVRVARVNQYVEITIRDNGCGIDQANLSKVFDPYFTTKNDGTGLGLALSVKIIEEHGGRLTIASTRGEYTQVLIELPV